MAASLPRRAGPVAGTRRPRPTRLASRDQHALCRRHGPCPAGGRARRAQRRRQVAPRDPSQRPPRLADRAPGRLLPRRRRPGAAHAADRHPRLGPPRLLARRSSRHRPGTSVDLRPGRRAHLRHQQLPRAEAARPSSRTARTSCWPRASSRPRSCRTCRQRGLLATAYCIRQNRWVTFWRRLVRDLAERRKPPLVLWRRGLRLCRAEPAIVRQPRVTGPGAADATRGGA